MCKTVIIVIIVIETALDEVFGNLGQGCREHR